MLCWQATIQRGNVNDHTRSCPHKQCPHAISGCAFTGTPSLVAQHEAAECEWRSLACPEPGCGARVAARDLEAHRARHALQQGAEQLARRPVESGEAEAALERMLELQ